MTRQQNMQKDQTIVRAEEVLRIEAESILQLIGRLDGKFFPGSGYYLPFSRTGDCDRNRKIRVDREKDCRHDDQHRHSGPFPSSR